MCCIMSYILKSCLPFINNQRGFRISALTKAKMERKAGRAMERYMQMDYVVRGSVIPLIVIAHDI